MHHTSSYKDPELEKIQERKKKIKISNWQHKQEERRALDLVIA